MCSVKSSFLLSMKNNLFCCCSVAKVMFDSLRPHGLQFVRLPYPLLLSNHLILCCPLLLLPSIFPSIPGSFPMSQFFTSGGQSIGASASSSVLPMTVPLGLTVLISLQSKGISRVFSNTTVQKHHFLGTQLSLWSNSHICR